MCPSLRPSKSICCRSLFAGLLLRRLIRLDGNGVAGTQRQTAIHDNSLAALQPFRYEPVITLPFPDCHGAHFGLAVLVHDPDKMTLRPPLDGPLRNQNRIGTNSAFQTGPNILVRPQGSVRIFNARPNGKGTGLRIIGRVRKGHVSGVRMNRSVHEDDFYNKPICFRCTQQRFLTCVRNFCISFSDRLKFIHIGERTATVVSRLFCGLI